MMYTLTVILGLIEYFGRNDLQKKCATCLPFKAEPSCPRL